MSVALTSFLTKLNNLIGDNIAGTTDGNGEADGTTFVDSALSKYEDDYFGGGENSEWWAYASSQLRSIKSSQGSSGTIIVHRVFTAPITSGTAYQIHKYDRDKKFAAINQALNDAYPYFYKRVEDETTLNGLGASNNKYTVPATFTEFPDQISKKHTAGTIVTYTPITDFVAKEVSGTRYFYADITIDDDILLVGKTYLSPFTTDLSTTELTTGQADVVALLAAAILYRNLSGLVNATNSERFDSLANRYEKMWDEKKIKASKPSILPGELDWSWLDE